jgi:hypothetical protein
VLPFHYWLWEYKQVSHSIFILSKRDMPIIFHSLTYPVVVWQEGDQQGGTNSNVHPFDMNGLPVDINKINEGK